MRVSIVLVVLALVALSAVSVSAGAGKIAYRMRPGAKVATPVVPSSPASKLPHPETTADAATLALWAKVRGEMEARNYTRPTRKQLVELGYLKQSQLGAPEDGTYGIDASSWIGQDAFSCMVSKGYTVGIIRNYMEVCEVDGNGVHTVANAWAGGMAHMDIYIFPSYGCGTSASDQVDAAIDSMGSIPFGTLWFDIETGGDEGADTDHAWLQAAIQRAVARIGGDRIGIYASEYEWGQVMGGYADVYSFPLWYPDYDGVPNFDSFSPFAGWDSPSMKQFSGDSSLCGADVDLNWY